MLIGAVSALTGELDSTQNEIERAEANVEQTLNSPDTNTPDTLATTSESPPTTPASPPATLEPPPATSERPETTHVCCYSPYSTLFAGGSYSYVSLKQTDIPFYSGNLWGFLVGYQYRKQNGLYFTLKGMWRQGATSGEAGQDYLHECKAEETAGYDFAFGPSQRGRAALYAGFGYRFMEQKIQQPALPTVRLEYDNFYVPIGTSIDYAIPFRNDCLAFGLCATWMPQVYPTVDIIPLGGARWILEYEVANGIIELPITYSHCNTYAVTLRPVFEYWKDGASIAVGSLCSALGLPASSYLFGGVNLEFDWRF
jgi:hypothetical protein